jgi:hypothetical protein
LKQKTDALIKIIRKVTREKEIAKKIQNTTPLTEFYYTTLTQPQLHLGHGTKILANLEYKELQKNWLVYIDKFKKKRKWLKNHITIHQQIIMFTIGKTIYLNDINCNRHCRNLYGGL